MYLPEPAEDMNFLDAIGMAYILSAGVLMVLMVYRLATFQPTASSAPLREMSSDSEAPESR